MNNYHLVISFMSAARSVSFLIESCISSVQFLVVLLESGDENVDNIMKRVFSSFYKMYLGDALVPEYEARLLSDKNN